MMKKKIVLILEVLREIIFLNADFLNSIGNDVIQFKQTLLSTELLVKKHMLFRVLGTHQVGVMRGGQGHL